MKAKLGKSIVFIGVCICAFILGCSVGVCSSETDYQLQNQEMVEGVFKPQGSKDISITKDIRLFQDTVVLGNLVLEDAVLDLDGNELEVTGNLIQKGGKIILNGGKLKVGKDYTIGSKEYSPNAYLIMRNENDYVNVNGSFVTYSSNSHFGCLTAGTLEVKGDFFQGAGSKSVEYSSNFLATGTHKVILSGEDIQTVEFESPDYSWMNILCITKPLDEGYNLVNAQRVWVKLVKLYDEVPKSSLEVNVLGNGYVKMNDEEILPTNYKFAFEVGSEIDLMAYENEGSEFAYWEDGEIGRIISNNPFYNLIVGTGAKLKAVFHENPEIANELMVIFKDRSGRILQSTKVAKNQAAVAPEDPYMTGYRFIGWDQDFSNVVSNMVVSPIFRRLADLYTVTVSGGKISTGETEEQYQFDIPVEVIADEALEGMKFSHWTQDGIKVSTKSRFSFFMPMRDTELTAVFVDEDEVLDTKPFIALAEDTIVDYLDRTIIFTATRNMEEGYQLIESGVILLQSDTELEGDITLETENIICGRISNDSTDQFYVRKINVEEEATWYGRAYLIYKNPEGVIETVYSEVTAKGIMELPK